MLSGVYFCVFKSSAKFVERLWACEVDKPISGVQMVACKVGDELPRCWSLKVYINWNEHSHDTRLESWITLRIRSAGRGLSGTSQ